MPNPDGTLTPEELLAAANAENALGTSAKSSAIDVNTLKKALDSARDSGLSLAEMFDKVSSSGMDMGPVKSVIGNVVSGFTGFVEKITGYSGIISAFGSSVTRDFLNPLKAANVDVLEGLLPKGSILSGKVEAINASLKNILEAQNTSRVGFVRLGMAIKDADDISEEYPTTLRRMAAAYSMSGEKLDGMMKSLQGVPIILDQNIKLGQNLANTQSDMVSELGKLSQAAKTFGMSEDEAAQRAKKGYMDFNQTVTETISSMATMSAAAKQTGIDRKIADDQIMASSQSLAIFGQKSDAAAKTWATFTGALKDTIPIRQVGEIVTDVTNSIAKMSVQNRAFIGMMSGMTQGRSAMGGALQLELAMRSPEGMEKNLQALTSSLSQFGGGKVITLEEAANNPQLEIQFQLQREMLGKISGISDTQTQNRVLEVLQKVREGGMTQVEGSKELSTLMDEGKSVQDKQLTSLEKIVGYAKVIAAEALRGDKQLSQLDNALAGKTPGVENWATSLNEIGQAFIDIPATLNAMEAPNVQGAIAEHMSTLATADTFKGIETTDFEKMISGFGKILEYTGRSIDMHKGKRPEPVKPITPATVHKVAHDVPENRPRTTAKKPGIGAEAYLRSTSDMAVAASKVQAAYIITSGETFKRDVKTAAESMVESVKGPKPVIAEVPANVAGVTPPSVASPAPMPLVVPPVAPPIAAVEPPKPTMIPFTYVNPAPNISKEKSTTEVPIQGSDIRDKINSLREEAKRSHEDKARLIDIKPSIKPEQSVPTEIRPTANVVTSDKTAKIASITPNETKFIIEVVMKDTKSEEGRKMVYDMIAASLTGRPMPA